MLTGRIGGVSRQAANEAYHGSASSHLYEPQAAEKNKYAGIFLRNHGRIPIEIEEVS